MARLAEPPGYRPRDPQDSPLVRVLRAHLDDFLERVRGEAGGLPAFVERQLRALIDCGDFCRGFLRAECDRCRAALIVPFSCKGRVCPSCAGRRMSEEAAHMVDRVLSRAIPYRQWVVTFPWGLSRRMAFDAGICSGVIRQVVEVLHGWLSERAERRVGDRCHPGSVVVVQRAADGATLMVHLHILAPDGAYAESPDGSGASFVRCAPPSNEDITTLVAAMFERVHASLCRRGFLDADDGEMPPPDAQLLLQCAAAGPQSATRAAQKERPGKGRRKPEPLCAAYNGMELHAATTVPARSTDALERLARYLLRPPVCGDRLRLLDDGRVAFTLKRMWKGGVRELVFSPVAFIARLAALIAPPYFHMTRYFGVFATASPMRALVVPKSPPRRQRPCPAAPRRPARMPWADLLSRVFLADVRTCDCGGRLRIVTAILDPDATAAIAAALLLSGTPSPPPR